MQHPRIDFSESISLWNAHAVNANGGKNGTEQYPNTLGEEVDAMDILLGFGGEQDAHVC